MRSACRTFRYQCARAQKDLSLTGSDSSVELRGVLSLVTHLLFSFCLASPRSQPFRSGSKDRWHRAAQPADYNQTRYRRDASKIRKHTAGFRHAHINLLFLCPGEEKLNILEIVKPVETVEVVIDPDAAGEEGTLVEEGQLIAVERSGLSDETSEQVTRWAAALEGYRKEQVRLGIPYGEERLNKTHPGSLTWLLVCNVSLFPPQTPCSGQPIR